MLANRAWMSVSGTPGTGTLTLNAALTGYLSFAAAGIADGQSVTYEIAETGVGWELGRGTYNSAGPSLSRDNVLITSAGNQTKLNFTSAASVMITAAAEDLQFGQVAASPSADVDNYSGVSAVGPDVTLILTPTNSVNLNGVAPGICRRLTVVNGTSGAGARLVIIPHERASQTAANRFVFSDQMPRFLMPGQAIAFVYSGSRWLASDAFSWTNVFHLQSDMLNLSPWGSGAGGTGAGPSTGGSFLATDATQAPQGAVVLSTGTTNAGAVYVGQTLDEAMVPTKGNALGLCRLVTPILSTVSEEYTVKFGFHDMSAGDTDVTDGVYWEYLRGTSVNWSRNCAGAGTRSKTAGSIAVNTEYIWLGIFINADWTQADFFTSQDGLVWTFAGSQSGANMPTVTEIVSFLCTLRKSAGTTARTVEIDWLGYRYDSLRGS